MSRRFFLPPDATAQPPEIDDSVELDTGESHHLIHVMRSNVGDRVFLFDGVGYELEGEISEIGRKQVTIRILDRQQKSLELDSEIVIAVPFPKADRQKFLVEKLTEIGVTQLVFIDSSRSGNQGNSKTIAKLERLVIEASKQCGRNHLMQLTGPVNLNDLIQNKSAQLDSNASRFFAHVDEESTSAGSALTMTDANTSSKFILIGPEGGFAPEEIESMIEHQWQPIRLGKTILRMETAAVVAAVLARE